MKLLTTIKPRADGTVTVVAPGTGTKYTFRADSSSALVADVEDDRDVAQLLALGSAFQPADEADFDRAEQMLSATQEETDDDGDPHDEAPDMLSAPVEANTPPVMEDDEPSRPAMSKKGAGRRARG